MGAKKSAEMIQARALMRAGKSAAEAARLAKIGKSAISQDPECRKIIEERKNAQKAA